MLHKGTSHHSYARQHGFALSAKVKRKSAKDPLSVIWLKSYVVNIQVQEQWPNHLKLHSCTAFQSHQLWVSHSCMTIHAMHLESINHFSYASAQWHRCLWLRLRLPNDNLDKWLYLTRSIKRAQTVRFHQEEFKGLVAPVVNTHPSDGNLHCGTVRLCKIKKRHP